MHAVDVCVATYKRPELLAGLLDSLFRQDLDGIRMRVIVVDNDKHESARPVVEGFQKSSPAELVYELEPLQSISLARNRALRHVRADYIAFVDDDEIVLREWLSALLETMEGHQADAVFGPVFKILPQDAPAWAKKSRAFKCYRRPTGQSLLSGGTCNALVRRIALGSPPQEFDPVFGLTGGEDSDFFFRLHLSGKKLVWCDEAVVHERIPIERLTLKWVCQRGFRGGQSFYRVFVTRYPLWKKILWLGRQGMQVICAALLLPASRLVSYRFFVAICVRLCASAGQWTVIFSNNYFREYDSRRYRED